MNIKRKNNPGFTLVELLIALMVSAVVLSAVAGLTFAFTSADTDSDEKFSNLSRMRYVTLRLSELIRNCKMICDYDNGDVVIWKNDDNKDGKVNVNEIVILEKGNFSSKLNILQYHTTNNERVFLNDIKYYNIKSILNNNYDFNRVTFLKNCRNINFYFDQWPPYTERMGISYEMKEGSTWNKYHLRLYLRAYSKDILNYDGSQLINDDDFDWKAYQNQSSEED